MGAGRLGLGTRILTRAGRAAKLAGILRRPGRTTVYNFEVEGLHSYFVGRSGGGVWVHNALNCGGQPTFELAERVIGQLQASRLGPLTGKLTPERLNELINSPGASRFLDASSGHINVIQRVDGVLLRITTPRDAFRIISVGPIKPNGLANGIASGRFIPLP